jgi:hypothetical protein
MECAVTIRELYHGGNGDKILQILVSRQMQPDSQHKIYFSESRYESVLMHGADLKRKLTFAVKVRLQIPSGTALTKSATPGVADTIVVTTAVPIQAEVLELYVRKPRTAAVDVVRGAADIHKFLTKVA